MHSPLGQSRVQMSVPHPRCVSREHFFDKCSTMQTRREHALRLRRTCAAPTTHNVPWTRFCLFLEQTQRKFKAPSGPIYMIFMFVATRALRLRLIPLHLYRETSKSIGQFSIFFINVLCLSSNYRVNFRTISRNFIEMGKSFWICFR